MAAKQYKLNIGDSMSAIDRRDGNFLSRQDAEARSGFVPRVALRWASTVTGSKAEEYLLLVNEIANRRYDELIDHPDLQFRLLAACGAGRQQRHEWIGMARLGKSPAKLHSFMADYYPFANARELDILLGKFTPETFEEFVNQSGCEPDKGQDVINTFYEKAGLPPKIAPKAKRKRA